MRGKLTAVGNSNAIILPKALLAKYHLKKGDALTFKETPEGILIMPYDPEFEDDIALVVSLMCLKKNNYQISTSELALFTLFYGLASNHIQENDFTHSFANICKPTSL